jgi:hypothetical protein
VAADLALDAARSCGAPAECSHLEDGAGVCVQADRLTEGLDVDAPNQRGADARVDELVSLRDTAQRVAHFHAVELAFDEPAGKLTTPPLAANGWLVVLSTSFTGMASGRSCQPPSDGVGSPVALFDPRLLDLQALCHPHERHPSTCCRSEIA